jgi:lysophospholipase L1-like esterase
LRWFRSSRAYSTINSLEDFLFMPRIAASAIGASVFALAALLCHTASAQAVPEWVGTWATAPFSGDPWHQTPTLVDTTLRQIVHTSIAGKALRIRITNEFGIEPLRIDAASVALSAGLSAVQPGSLHTLAFAGQPSIVLPIGAAVVSDPVDLATPAAADLAISIYLPVQQISAATGHSGSQQINYMQRGNLVTAPSFTAPTPMPSWFFIKGVDVQPATPHTAAVVAYGDSITDGAASTDNQNHRWPDYLAARLLNNPATARLSVLNEGIGGNCVLVICVGPNALARFDRDVLSQAGVRYVIVLESINDIGRLHDPNQPNYNLTAEDLEQGFSQLAVRAHEHGIKIFAATILPYQGAGYATEKGEQIRQAVNAWILHNSVFDGFIDFDKATRNAAQPLTIDPQYDSGDHLHPKDAGYSVMANSIDLSLFK